MDPLDVVVAGLSCRQVLGHLGDFLDGDLPGETLAAVQQHLAGCQTCERFGGRVATVVAALREVAVAAADVPPGAHTRLLAHLAAHRP
ncbi:MAG: zf-HC2 domain-containing protein [Gemmatimonadetes bacterium]|nr:zf-HC2 domain-containing protein [Gemmatimonadota bacterium]